MKQLLLVLAIVMLSLDPLRAQSSHQEQNGSSCPQAFGVETEDDQGIQPETTLLALNQAGQPERIGQRGGGRRGGRKGGKRGGGTPDGKRKPSISDTLRANIYADNSFILYINGKLIAVDSIEFIPHNVVSVDILPEYPMTIAVMAKDNAHPTKGTEYVNNIGDGGFILKIGAEIVTNSAWKAKNFFHGPINGDVSNPRVRHTEIPKNWFAPGFDDSQWASAKEFSEEEIGPKGPYFDHDFAGAKFIWTDDLELDNTVIFRFKIDGPMADFYTGR